MEKIEIWGENIPYNTGKSKLDDMPVIHKEWTMKQIFESPDSMFNKNDVLNSMEATDTMVYLQEMLPGKCNMNYDDIPYLDAYPVKGSKYCVLDVPGGAYMSVSMDNEGEDVAKTLNEQGISVFVLRYRTYPYRYPVAFADCQRALKWLIAHAEDYGYDADKISMLGYSAGGNLVASTYHLFMEEDLLPNDYKKDDVDKISAKVATLGLIYPKLIFTNASKFLTMIVGFDTMNDDKKKAEAIEKYTLTTKVQDTQVPTFLVNATNDDLIPSEDILEYAMRLHKHKVPFEMHNYSRGGHGFGGCVRQDPAWPLDTDGLESWMQHYALWLSKNL
jgi:acetyl esterase/lipase